jgi:hypothetical protein
MAEWFQPFSMASILVLADDLTGALEAGAKFATHNFRAVVTTRRDRLLDFPVTIVDTETPLAGGCRRGDFRRRSNQRADYL